MNVIVRRSLKLRKSIKNIWYFKRKAKYLKRRTYLEYIFNKETRQKLVILEMIFNNPKGIGVDELGKRTSIVRRTIYKCIEEIKLIIKNNLVDADIVVSRWDYMFTGDKMAYLKIVALISQNEPIVNLTKLLLESSCIIFSKFCVDNFIGESTFRRYLGNVNRFLRRFGLKISIIQDKIIIIGEEKKVRYVMISFLWRIYRGVIWPFETIAKKEVDKVVSSIVPRDIHSGKRNLLSFYIAVHILRIRSEQYINKQFLPKYLGNLVKSNDIKFLKLSNLFSNHELPQIEINYLVFSLYFFPEFHVSFQNINETLKILKVQSPKSFYSIQRFITFVKNKHPEWDEKCSKHKYFIPMLISGRIFFDTFSDMYFNISSISIFRYSHKTYPNLLPSITNSILKFEPTLSKNQLKTLSLRYAQAYVLEFEPNDFEPEIRLLLDTDVPLYADKIIVERISNILFSRFNFKIKTTNLDFVPDLTVSTGFFDSNYENPDLLYISPEVNQMDAERLIEACESVLRKKTYK